MASDQIATAPVASGTECSNACEEVQIACPLHTITNASELRGQRIDMDSGAYNNCGPLPCSKMDKLLAERSILGGEVPILKATFNASSN